MWPERGARPPTEPARRQPVRTAIRHDRSLGDRCAFPGEAVETHRAGEASAARCRPRPAADQDHRRPSATRGERRPSTLERRGAGRRACGWQPLQVGCRWVIETPASGPPSRQSAALVQSPCAQIPPFIGHLRRFKRPVINAPAKTPPKRRAPTGPSDRGGNALPQWLREEPRDTRAVECDRSRAARKRRDSQLEAGTHNPHRAETGCAIGASIGAFSEILASDLLKPRSRGEPHSPWSALAPGPRDQGPEAAAYHAPRQCVQPPLR